MNQSNGKYIQCLSMYLHIILQNSNILIHIVASTNILQLINLCQNYKNPIQGHLSLTQMQELYPLKIVIKNQKINTNNQIAKFKKHNHIHPKT